MHVENKIFVINCCKFVIVIYDKIPQKKIIKTYKMSKLFKAQEYLVRYADPIISR